MKTKFKVRVLLVCASLVLSFLALELILRFTGIVHHGPQRFYTYIEYDPLLGWSQIPNSTVRFRSSEFNVKLRFNSKGMRGKEEPFLRQAGTYRILVLGDSFVEGHGVNLEDGFTEILERNLCEKLPHIDFEVVAMGTSGYSTDQELLHLESEGLKYRPDLVLLMVYYDDIMPNIRPESWGVPKPMFVLGEDGLDLTNVPVPRTQQTDRRSARMRIGSWLHANSDLFFLATSALKNSPLYGPALDVGLISPPLKKGTDPWYEQRVFATGYPEVEEAWKLMSALLERMRKRVEASGGELLAFHIPIRERIHESIHMIEKEYRLPLEEWTERVYVNKLVEVCKDVDIPLIHPEEAFAGYAESGEQLYFNTDLHWNRAGHRAAAVVAADFIAELMISNLNSVEQASESLQ